MPIALPGSSAGPITTPTTLVLEVRPTTDYTIGNTLRVRATLRDELTGTLVDPDLLALSFRVRQGGLAAVTYTSGADSAVVKVSVGVYDLILLLAAAGKGMAHAVVTGSRSCSAVAQWQAYDPNF